MWFGLKVFGKILHPPSTSPMDSPRNEFQELLDSLPSEIGVTKDLLHLYKGFWYPEIALQGSLASEKQFQAQSSDIILVTAPKSGTTWLKSLVFSIAHRTQSPPSDPNHPLLSNNPHALVPFIQLLYTTNKFPADSNNTSPRLVAAQLLYTTNKFPADSNNTSPRLFASHVPYELLPETVRTLKCRIIYMCRDPKDTFVSLWHFGNKILSESVPLEQAFDQYCKGVAWFGPIWEQALEYWKLSNERPREVLFLKFEDLQNDITSQVKKIAVHLGCPFSEEEENGGVIEEIAKLCSFEKLSNLEVNKTGERCITRIDNKDFFRKGEVGDWMNLLTPSMAEKLDHVIEEKLRGSGLTLN